MKIIWRAALAGCIAAIAAGCAAPGAPAAGQASLTDSCINPTRIEKQEILNDQEIQFTMSNGEVWLNRLPRTCPGLKFEGGFSWDVRGVTVCSNEQIIRVLNTGTTCALGVFTRTAAGS